MSVKTWLLLTLGSFVEMIYQTIIVNSLIDFEIDHVNPLDMCSQLEKKINPVMGICAGISLISLLDIGKTWLIIIAHLAIIGTIFYTKNVTRKNRVFDPMLIVRDMTKIKTRHIVFLVIELIAVIYCLIQAILTALS